jgi:hypothetical protein
MSIFDAGKTFLQLAAQQLTVDVQESHTSSHPDIWLDEHTLTLLNNPATDLSIFEDAERKRILRRASSYVVTGESLYRKMPDGSLKIVPAPFTRLER